MLTAFGEQRLPQVTHRSAVGVDRDVMVYTVQRSGLTYDSALTPASRGPARSVHFFWFVFSGNVSVDGVEYDGPCAFVMPERAFIGENGQRTNHLVARGAFHAMEVHVRGDLKLVDVTTPRPVILDPTAWELARSLSARMLTAPEGDTGDSPSAIPLINALAAGGHVEGRHAARLDHPPSELQARVWRALTRAYGRHGARARVKLLATIGETPLAQRTIERAIAALYDDYLLPGGTWRDMIGYMRLSLASLLLSASEVTVAEVAQAVGFSHPNALTNAYQRVGFASPIEIRAAHARSRPPI